MPEPVRLAAIDAGTNTTRLLVADVADGHPQEVVRLLTFTRLGRGVDSSGRLAPAAIDRTVAAVTDYVGRCRDLGVSGLRIAGTSAVRDAANRADLLAAITAASGAQMEVLAGSEEAALSFAGATADLAPGAYLVLDIGGGSTEFAAGAVAPGGEGTLAGAVSLNLGVVRLTERHLYDDPPSAAQLGSLEAGVDAELAAVDEAIPGVGGRALVAVAGTVTSLAAIAAGLAVYEPAAVHGSVLSRERIDELYHRLAGMPPADRERMVALPPGRADVIVAGCAILSRVTARWGFPALRVSEHDILDGLVQTLQARLSAARNGGHDLGKSCKARPQEAGPAGPDGSGGESR